MICNLESLISAEKTRGKPRTERERAGVRQNVPSDAGNSFSSSLPREFAPSSPPPPAAVLPKRNRKKRNAAERSTLSVSDRDRVGRHHPTRSIDLIYLFDDDVVVARVTSVGLRTSRRRIYGGNREEATRETRVFRVGFPARHTFATFAIVHIWLS